MVMEASSLLCRRRPSSGTSGGGGLPPTPLSVLVSSATSSTLGDAWTSRGSRGPGERKPLKFSQFWVEEETWEMTGKWTEEEEEEAEGAAAVEELAAPPGYTAWCWDSSSSYWTPKASSSS